MTRSRTAIDRRAMVANHIQYSIEATESGAREIPQRRATVKTMSRKKVLNNRFQLTPLSNTA